MSVAAADGTMIPVVQGRPRYFLHAGPGSPIGSTLHFLPQYTGGSADGKIVSKVTKGDTIGSARYTFDDESFGAPLVADADYTPKPTPLRPAALFTVPTVLLGGVLAGSAFAMRKKARRMYGGRFGT